MELALVRHPALRLVILAGGTVFAAFLTHAPAPAAGLQPELALNAADTGTIVTARATSSPVPADSPVTAAVVLTIRNGWHINAHDPADENLIGTSIDVEPQPFIDSVAVHYPPSTEILPAFSDAPVQVYDGMVPFSVTLFAAPGTRAGRYAVPAEVTYQACNASVCLQPRSLRITLPLLLTDPTLSPTTEPER